MSSNKNGNNSFCDRISSLPSNITESILERVPICDAVATSILSKEWMHKWRRVANLVFDEGFGKYVYQTSNEDDTDEHTQLLYSYIIGKILLLHLGPVQKFILHVPQFFDSVPKDLGSWMLVLSQKDVKELTIEVPYADIRLPSSFFRCSQLQHLKLKAQELYLSAPHSVNGFSNLLSLDFSGFIIDGDELSKLISSCPLLERLTVHLEEVEEVLVVDAPRLRELSAFCPTFGSLRLKNVFNVTKITIQYGNQPFGGLKELMNIVDSVPKVEAFTLCSLDYAMGMPRKDSPKSLPTSLDSLRSLTLLKVALLSRRSISLLLCLIKSSPNLQKLNLEILGQGVMKNEAALHFLDLQMKKSQTLNKLLTVKMKGLEGNQLEIEFIKFILTCAPVLNTVYLTGGEQLNDAEVTLLSELLRCSRLSRHAQVVYSRFPGDSSIFDF